MIITVKDDTVHIEGYEGAFYRYTTNEGNPSACGIWDNWYTGIGIDESGKTYTIVWAISDMEAYNRGDEDCCDWFNPNEVIDNETGLPVPEGMYTMK